MERFDTLLIFSPSNENRVYLRASLKEGFNLLEAVTVQQLMLLLKQNKDCVAALLLDITSMNDEERKQFMQKEYVEQLHGVQVIVFTEDDDLVRLNRAFHLGAADVIPIDYEPYAMLRRIENVVQVRLHKRSPWQHRRRRTGVSGNSSCQRRSLFWYPGICAEQHCTRWSGHDLRRQDQSAVYSRVT